MSSIVERLQQIVADYTKKCKEDPRHNIKSMADPHGHVRVYFGYIELTKYNRGKAAKGSTERFVNTDFVVLIPMERIESITNGNTIVQTRDWGGIQ